MARPKAYDPQRGYQYQIFQRHPLYNGREWEHTDYATDSDDKDYLLNEYALAYRGQGFEFKTELLPQKYWDMEKVTACRKARMQRRLEKRKITQQ